MVHAQSLSAENGAYSLHPTITVSQKEFSSILAAMQPIVTKRTALEATACILIVATPNELVLKATDLEVSLQYSVPLTATTLTEQLSFLVSGKRLFELVRELEGTVQLAVEHHQLIITAGTSCLQLNIKDAQEFPPFPERIENLMHLDAPTVSMLLEKVSFIVPQNNGNPALNGLLMEISSDGLVLTGTDGHCLAQVRSTQYTLPESRTWLLPRRAIIEIRKLLEGTSAALFLGLCGNQLVFSTESFNFFTKLLVDTFPQYKAILQKEGFGKWVIPRAEVVKALRRASCLLSGQFIATQLTFMHDTVAVYMHNKEVGSLKETLPIIQSPEDASELEIRFYAPYLLEGLQMLEGATMECYLAGRSQPMIIEQVNPAYTFTYLVMPVSPTTM